MEPEVTKIYKLNQNMVKNDKNGNENVQMAYNNIQCDQDSNYE